MYWDHHHVYMEHRFISRGDNFINAISMCKMRFMNCSAEKVFNDLLSNSNCSNQKPNMTPELEIWIKSNEISSQVLRNNINDSVVTLDEYM